jgi:hypothetical protein
MGVGIFIVVSEELSGRVHPELITLAASLLGGPSIIALIQLARGKSTQPADEGTPASSSPSPARRPSPP